MVSPILKRPIAAALAVPMLWTLACISVGGSPNGRYGIVSYTVHPAGGKAQTVEDAGILQFGHMLSCDSGWMDPDGPVDPCRMDRYNATAMSLMAWDWVGDGLVPLRSPHADFFALPEWNGDKKSWDGPIPLGQISCVLTRESQNPLVLVGRNCSGPDGTFDVELVMDR